MCQGYKVVLLGWNKLDGEKLYFESLSIGLSLVGLVRVYTCGLQLNCLIILLYEFLIIVNIFKHANKPDFFSRFFSQLHKFASLTATIFASISSFQSSNLWNSCIQHFILIFPEYITNVRVRIPASLDFFKDIFLQLHKLVFICDDHLCVYSIYTVLVSFG